MKRFILSVGALLLSCAMLAACGQKDNFIAVDTTPTAIAAETDATLKQPEDFQFDPMTGEFSFTATDDRTAYYFVRIFPVEDGAEATEYLATSARIMGGSTGAVTGKPEREKGRVFPAARHRRARGLGLLPHECRDGGNAV